MIRPFGGKHPRLAEGVFVEDSAQVIGDVELGGDANVWFGAVVRGDDHYIPAYYGPEPDVRGRSTRG